MILHERTSMLNAVNGRVNFRLHWLLAICALLLVNLQTASAHAASISLSSSVEDISYDLGNIHLQLEQLDSSMRLTPTTEGKLLVENLHAQRLIITMRDQAIAPSSKADSSAGLPDKIKLPLAIMVRQASIQHIRIISGGDVKEINDVQMNLEADSESIRLELLHASTPWGDARLQLSINNQKPFAINGDIQLTQNKAQHYDIRALLTGDLQHLQFTSNALLQKQADGIALIQSDSSLTNPANIAGTLHLSGSIGLFENQPLAVHATLRELKPELLWLNGIGLKTGVINADIDVSGNLAKETQLNFKLSVHDSVWQGEPLTMQASLIYANQGLQQIQALATLASNKITLNGNLGAASDVLLWQADLPEMNRLGRDFGGKLLAEGELQGAFSSLSNRFKITGDELRLPGALTVTHLQGQGNLVAGNAGKLEGQIQATGLRRGQAEPLNLEAKLSGTRQQHLLSLTADGAQLKFLTALQGSLGGDYAWQGLLQKLDYQQAETIATLETPAKLAYQPTSGFNISKLALKVAQGHLYLDELNYAGATFSTKGRIVSIGLRDIPAISLPQDIKGNLLFSGEWDIQLDDSANGHLQLRHIGGDLEFTGADNHRQILGLQQLEAALILNHNSVQLNAVMRGTGLGQMQLQAISKLTSTPHGFELRADAPLQVDIASDMHTLSWLAILPTFSKIQVDGKLVAKIHGEGTISQPRLLGNIHGEQLQLVWPDEGVKLDSGILQANLQNDLITLEKLQFNGGEGTLHATGNISVAQQKLEANLNWIMDRFTALSRTDRLLVLDGSMLTTLHDSKLDISGDIKVRNGLIELPKADLPVLGDDVIVIGREIPEQASSLDINIGQLRFDFGANPKGIVNLDKQFVIRGRGIDAYLTGAISLNGKTNALNAQGSVEAHGTYLAYGQVLDIERGIVNFSGPIDNPGLNIRAMRNNQTVKAGVEVTGNVQAPTVKLVSTPEVSDSNKLAWLVLGHDADQTGKNEFAMLSLAAGAMFSQDQSVPLQTRFARAAGLDALNVNGSDVKSSSVNLGKRLSSNLYLSYEKSLTGLLNVARLTYEITKRWSIRTQAGSESAVDVLYTFSFK